MEFSQTVLIKIIQFSVSTVSVYTQLNIKTVLFQTTHFSESTVSISRTVQFKTIQLKIQKQFHFKKLV